MTVPSSLVGMIRQTIGTALGLTIYAVLFLLLANSPAVQQPKRNYETKNNEETTYLSRLQKFNS